jgi:tRNA(Phe) wybutosine-synthesizing methylase Tyw3
MTWTCLLSSCSGRIQMVSTEGAKTEGKWIIPGCRCLECGRHYTATKSWLGLLRV